MSMNLNANNLDSSYDVEVCRLLIRRENGEYASCGIAEKETDLGISGITRTTFFLPCCKGLAN